MRTMKSLKFAGLFALSAVAAFSAVPDRADALVLSGTLGDGASKDFQNAPPADLTSKFGASLNGTTIEYDTVLGTFTVVVMNSGEGTVTGFALALSPDIFPQKTTGPASGKNTLVDTVTVAFSSDLLNPSPGCEGGEDCDISDVRPVSNDVADGFAKNGERFDIGWSSHGNEGIEEDEKATFIWDFDVSQLLATPVVFSDLFAGFLVEAGDDDCDSGNGEPCEDIPGVFWVAHIQQLAGGASDHIGGSTRNGNELPEPMTLALLGAGLVGLGIARRRLAA